MLTSASHVAAAITIGSAEFAQTGHVSPFDPTAIGRAQASKPCKLATGSARRPGRVITSLIVSGLTITWPGHKAYSQSNTLAQNQSLREGQYLRSMNGAFVALMQTDGNFVVYHGTSPTDLHGALSFTGKTPGGCPCFAVVQGDGNFVVYHGTGINDQHDVIWASDQYTKNVSGPYVGIMQDDGNFVVYHGRSNDDRGGAQWSMGKTDPVIKYDNISSFNYDLAKGHINGISSLQIFSQQVSNDTSTPQTSTISGGGQTTEQSSWSDTYTKTYGVKESSEVTIPIVGGIKENIELSYQYQDAHMEGGSSTATTEYSFSTPITLDPHTKGSVTALATVADIVVPYTLTGTVVFQSGARMPTTVSGQYTGKNSYDVQVVLEASTSSAPNAAPHPFKKTLLKEARPMLSDKRPSTTVRLSAPATLKLVPGTR